MSRRRHRSKKATDNLNNDKNTSNKKPKTGYIVPCFPDLSKYTYEMEDGIEYDIDNDSFYVELYKDHTKDSYDEYCTKTQKQNAIGYITDINIENNYCRLELNDKGEYLKEAIKNKEALLILRGFTWDIKNLLARIIAFDLLVGKEQIESLTKKKTVEEEESNDI